MWQAHFQWRGYEERVLINTLSQEQECTGLIPELFQLIHDYACILDWESLYQVPVVEDAGFYSIVKQLIGQNHLKPNACIPSRYAFHPETDKIQIHPDAGHWFNVLWFGKWLVLGSTTEIQTFQRVVNEFLEMQRLYGIPNDRVQILVGQYPIPFHASGNRFGLSQENNF
jgi:hypothetical protein